MGQTTLATVAREFRAGAAIFRKELAKQFRGNYVAAREVEVLPCDSEGARLGNGDPEYISLSDLTGKNLQEMVDRMKRDGDFPKLGLSLGYDVWENAYEFMHAGEGYDYEPRVDHYETDVSMDQISQGM